jgi:hypothetical protein
MDKLKGWRYALIVSLVTARNMAAWTRMTFAVVDTMDTDTYHWDSHPLKFCRFQIGLQVL